MNKLTLEKAKELAKTVVDREGRDFVYNPHGGPCYYVPISEVPKYDFNGFLFAPPSNAPTKSKTGCIVGEMARLFGVDMAQMGQHREGVTKVPVYQMFGLSSEPTDYPVITYLFALQNKQDIGHSWGEALDHANKVLQDIAPINFQTVLT